MLMLGLFLAQMLTVGIHSIEHTEHIHDCEGHSSSISEANYECSEEFEGCSFCLLSISDDTSLVGGVSFDESVSSFASPCKGDVVVARHRISTANLLRGPPFLS